MGTLTVRPGNKSYSISPAISILNTLLKEGHPIMHKCGGRAQCGTCRIRILSGGERMSPVREPERLRLGEEALAAGFRLACQSYAVADLEVEIPSAGDSPRKL